MKTIILIPILFILISGPVLCFEGKTYPIREKDAITEMQAAAAKVNWKKILSPESKEKKLRNFKPKGLVTLPQTKATRSYVADMSYTLTVDVPDNKGGILYPKGYTFNPLDYTRYDGTIVVIDGTKKKQVEWFEKSGYKNKLGTKILITSGSYYDLSNRFNQSVFFALPEIVERLQLKRVPAVARQEKNRMIVTEIGL
jgi:conjugal transfer pilus assembly protein TraW